jgi:hypothetical protein
MTTSAMDVHARLLAHRRQVTASELDVMPRKERVWAMWEAMAPASRERAWGALTEDQRVQAIKVMFSAAEEEGPC